MAAPKGNKNGLGNKGGGRKPLPIEAKALHDAQNLFFDKQSQEELEAAIQSGKFSLAQRFLLNAMEGSTIELITMAKKALPDISKVDHTTKGEKLPSPILNAIRSDDSTKEDTKA